MIKKGDNIIVITGKDKGKTGKVLHSIPKSNSIVIEGINIVKKHQKSKSQQQKGGIIEKPMPIHISNVKIEQGNKTKKPIRQARDKQKKQKK